MGIAKSRIWWGVAGCLAAGAAAAGSAVVNDASRYPEGPLAADRGVYYAEMGSDRVMFSADGRNEPFWSARGCGPTSVAAYGGSFAILCHIGRAVAVVSRTGQTRAILAEDETGRSVGNPNASAADGHGGVYFSSSGAFSPDAPATGAVLYLDPTGRLRRVAEDIRYANGVAVSTDGRTLFVSEHLARNVLAYAIAADGSLSGRRVFLNLDRVTGADASRRWDVGPDGLATDRSGHLYIAEYGAGRVLIVSPAGELLATLDVDERWVTAPALTADEATVYVTAPAARDPSVPGKVYAFDNPLQSQAGD